MRPMNRSKISTARAVLCVAATGCAGAGLLGCGVDRLPPPPDEGIYGFANGCYAIEGFDGDDDPTMLTVTADTKAFVFAEDAEDTPAARFTLRASDLGTYLLYDQDKRYVTAAKDASGKWTLPRVEKLDSKLSTLDDTFESPAEWELETSARDAQRYQLKHHASGLYLSTSADGALVASASSAAIVTLFPKDGCAAYPELTVDATGTPTKRQWDDGTLYGIAELHSHMMSNFGFGGGNTFHGAPFHRLGVEHALPDCEAWHGVEGRKDVVGYFYDGAGSGLSVDALAPILLSGEISEFNHETAGYPDFKYWPNAWRSSTHQTMYYKWLERAYLGGLRLVVQHATGNSVLCDLITGIHSQTGLYACNDMVSVDREILETRNLERYIDAQSGGPGKGWLRVVDTPAAARAAILEGKMAVVLGIEISNLFDCFLTPHAGFEPCTADSVRAKIDHYRELGVRVVFPVHKFDNAFTSGDGSSGIIELGNFINSGHWSDFVTDCPGISANFDGGDVTFGGLNKPRDVYDSPAPNDMSGFAAAPLMTLLPFLDPIQEPPLVGEYCQHHGLTPLGETLLQELMKRGMMIDVAHLPQRSLARAYELMEANAYPVLKTHGDTNGGRVYANGGMAGTSLGRCSDGTPGSMGKGLKASIAEVVAKGGYPAEGLSFDLNGFAGGPRPRFGPDTPCSTPQSNPITYPFTSFDGAVTFDEPELGNRKVDFNDEGMIDIALLPELIEDARRDGVTDAELEPIFHSAEAFVRMWEHAEARGQALGP